MVKGAWPGKIPPVMRQFFFMIPLTGGRPLKAGIGSLPAAGIPIMPLHPAYIMRRRSPGKTGNSIIRLEPGGIQFLPC